MPQLALAFVAAEAATAVWGTAAVIGSLTAGNIAFAVGSAVGSMLFAPTQKSYGPRLSDLKATQTAYGACIPFVEGHPRLPGVVAWSSDKREIASTSSQGGKGGGGATTTNYTYEIDLLVLLAENECEALRRVWNSGDVVWSPGATDTDLWKRITFYTGAADQLPDPTYEAAVGVGSAPAYRGRAYVFIESLQLGSSGQMPALTFEVGSAPEFVRPGTVLSLWNFDTGTTALTLGTYGAFGTVGGPVSDQSELGSANGWYLHGYSWPGGTPLAKPTLTPGTGLTLPDYDAGKGFGVFQCATAWTISGDFTIEVRLNPEGAIWTGSGSTHRILCAIAGGSGSGALATNGDWLLEHISVGGVKCLQFSFRAGGVNYSVSSGSTDVAASALNEISVCRHGASLKIFIGGVLVGTNGAVSTADIGGAAMNICGTSDGAYLVPNDFASGIYTSLRVTAGMARYNTDYSPGATWTLDSSSVDLTYYGSEPTLQAVVERQCTRAGLDLAYVDASALASNQVHSMAITQLASPRSVIDMLSQAYFFTAVESDILRFRWRGADAVQTIPYEDLVFTEGAEPLAITKANDIELPVQVNVKFSNLYDDFQDGNESSDRLISSGQNVSQVEFPLGLTPTEARKIADAHVMDAPASCLHFGPFGLTRDYAALEPTDVVVLADANGNQFRVRLTKKGEAGGVLTFEGVSDSAHVLVSAAITTTSGYTFSTVVQPPINTLLELLDIPILRDADDDAGFYAAVKPDAGFGYPGAALFKSADDVTFDSAATFTTAAVFGTATTVLAAGVVGLFDEAHSVTVDVGAGELSGVSRDALLSGTSNVMLLGSEVIQFRDAQLVSTGVYKLKGLLRGLRGTEWAMSTHTIGERAVLLDTQLRRVAMTTSDIGVAFHWKGVTLGRSTASATSESFTDTGIGKKPLAPVNVRVALTGADAVVSWDRRSRLADVPATGAIPLGEDSEAWEIDVIPPGGTAATFHASSSPATLPAMAAAYTAAGLNGSGGAASAVVQGGYIYVITRGTGGSRAKKYNPADLSIAASMDITVTQGALCMVGDGTNLYTVDDSGGSGLLRARKYDANLVLLSSSADFPLVADGGSGGNGPTMVVCAGSLWVGLAYSNVVRRINPSTMATVTDIAVTTADCLATDGTYVYARRTGTGSPYIAKIDPATNTVVATFTVDEDVTFSYLACCGGYLFTQKHDGSLRVTDAGTGANVPHSLGQLGASPSVSGGYIAFLGGTNRGVSVVKASSLSLYGTFTIPPPLTSGSSYSQNASLLSADQVIAARNYGDFTDLYNRGSASTGTQVKVYQMSALVGRGYAGQFTL